MNISQTPYASTVAQLREQWNNPSDILSILMIIGGDVVHTALAQEAGHWISPVCFSFGWVAYSFGNLVRILGDGRLLPPPDYPVLVFNVESTYVRCNRNWILGRIMRDNELYMNTVEQLDGRALRIAIYHALPRRASRYTIHSRSWVAYVAVTLSQLAVAAIPFGRYGEWGILLVTGIGIVASAMAGASTQWRLEKHPLRHNTTKILALTSGNGSRDIMIIHGKGEALDLEELAASESPRSDRLWQAVKGLSTPMRDEHGVQRYHRNGNEMRRAKMMHGLPLGVWITRLESFCQITVWLALLIMVAGLKSHTWYLVLVGVLGMLQNAMLAAAARKPEVRGLHLKLVDTIITSSVMDGLMDLESTIIGAGDVLRHEFFPGKLRQEETEWWDGARSKYDLKRQTDPWRGRARSSDDASARASNSDLTGDGEAPDTGNASVSTSDMPAVVPGPPLMSTSSGTSRIVQVDEQDTTMGQQA